MQNRRDWRIAVPANFRHDDRNCPHQQTTECHAHGKRPRQRPECTPTAIEQDQKWRRQCACSDRSEEHTSELQSLMRISYAVFCLKKKTSKKKNTTNQHTHK